MMDIFLIIIGIFVLLLVVTLALRLRLHVELSPNRKTLFFGLGRTGPFIDLESGQGKIRLFGINVRSFLVYGADDDTDDTADRTDEPREESEQPSPSEPAEARKPEAAVDSQADMKDSTPESTKKSRRRRIGLPVSFKTARELLSHSTRAVGRYIWRLFRGTRIEELDARIRGGFDSPDETGRAFGYFQAVSGAIPFVGRHITYYPDYTGQSISGSFRMGLALPLYRFVGSTLLFLWDLPLRDIIRLAIGKKKGADDVK